MNKRRHWRLVTSVAVSSLVFGSTLAGYVSAAGDTGRATTEQRVAGARTRADHEALADSFEQAAKALDAKAADHEALARTYGKLGYLKDKPGLIAHCASLVDQYRAAAKETRELARAHREMAAKAVQN